MIPYIILTVLFLLFLLAFIFYGRGIVLRRTVADSEAQLASCSVCRLSFPSDELLVREVGDYKLLYFCPACVRNLSHELEHRIPEGKS